DGLLDGSVDDFIRRPVDPVELQGRVRVLLHSGAGRRRAERGDLEGPHGVIVRPQTREILIGDDAIHLRPLECAVLRLLLERRGEVVTIDTLLDEVWRPGPSSSRNLVEAQISRLRSKLRGTEAEDLITTVHGVGYLIR
ncbi:MAG: winged helix-turn-helix domain-containing protein, partial [Dehalococcoidia bacterium]